MHRGLQGVVQAKGAHAEVRGGGPARFTHVLVGVHFPHAGYQDPLDQDTAALPATPHAGGHLAGPGKR